MQQHTATFIAEPEVAATTDLPQFVKDEFNALLEYGILAHGFLELRCGECGHGKLMAFSCKRRGSVMSPVESMQQLAALGPADGRSGRRGGRRACPRPPGRAPQDRVLETWRHGRQHAAGLKGLRSR